MSSQVSTVDFESFVQFEIDKLGVSFDVILQEVSDAITPVWPLKDYVAVNPYFGLANRNFNVGSCFPTRLFSLRYGSCPSLIYAAEYRAGQIDEHDVTEALSEIVGRDT